MPAWRTGFSHTAPATRRYRGHVPRHRPGYPRSWGRPPGARARRRRPAAAIPRPDSRAVGTGIEGDPGVIDVDQVEAPGGVADAVDQALELPPAGVGVAGVQTEAH